MSDSISTEKISDYINVLLKKQKIFQKIDTIKYYSWYFILFSSFIGITGIYIGYSNYKHIKKISNNTEKNLDEIKNSISDIRNALDEIKKPSKMDNYGVITNSSSPVSSTLSDSDYTPFKSINSNLIKNDESNEDTELLDECYDNIPLNDFK
jgi:hypothetical protein